MDSYKLLIYMNEELKRIYKDLGISNHLVLNYKLDICLQPSLSELTVIDIDYEGKPFIMSSKAAKSWAKMYKAAHLDGVFIEPFSGFRSYQYQKKIIEKKLKLGEVLEIIITQVAIPGFSEHHSGRAVDVCMKGNYSLNEDFDKTEGFLWLKSNAQRFNFRLSYPKDNKKKIIYEPWHWYYFS